MTELANEPRVDEIQALNEKIAQLEQANKELRNSEQVYRALFEHAGFAITLRNPATKELIFFNKTEYESLGYTKEEYEQTPDNELILDSISHRQKIRDLMKEKGSVVFETKQKARCGETRTRLISSVAVPINGELCHLNICTDITRMKQVESDLKQAQDELESRVQQRTTELHDKTRELMESNMALKILLEKRDDVIRDVEERLLENTKQLVLPHLDKLKKTPLDQNQMLSLVELEFNLNDILSPFLKRLSNQYHGLTPTEIRVAAHVREGKSSKEIAALLNVTAKTIDVHRERLRKKLGLNNQKINLMSHLRSLEITNIA